MTSAEWNDNVQKNYNKWTQEEREKALRLAQQREQMRNELQKQMAAKAEKDNVQKQIDRIKHQEHLAAIERKLIQDEMEAIEHNEKIRQNVSINQQYEQLNKFKFDEQTRLR